MKICTKCKVEKSLNEFYNKKSGKDGKTSQCKKCISDHQSSSDVRKRINELRRSKFIITDFKKGNGYREIQAELLKLGKKKCSKCEEIKLIDEFSSRKASSDGKEGRCKSCKKIIMNNWRSKNVKHEDEYRERTRAHRIKKQTEWRRNIGQKPIKVVLRNDIGQECCTCNEFKKWDSFSNWKNGYNGKARSCKECSNKATKERRLNNINESRKKDADYRMRNTESLKEYNRKWKEENKDRIKAYDEMRRPKTRAENNARYKEKYGIDAMFTAKIRVRSSIKNAFTNRGYPKTSKTTDLLGCSFETVKQHLESQFEDGMSWENHGEWHIDHKLPLAIADTVADLEILSYYKNLQPLWAIDNLKKNASVPWE